MALCAEGFLLESAPAPDPDTALRMYEQAARMAPERIEPKVMWARALVRAGRTAEASPLLDEILALQPKNALALGMRMRVNGTAGRWAAAWEDGKVLVGLPVSRFESEFWGEAAVNAMASGHTAEGLELMRKYLSWNPMAIARVGRLRGDAAPRGTHRRSGRGQAQPRRRDDATG